MNAVTASTVVFAGSGRALVTYLSAQEIGRLRRGAALPFGHSKERLLPQTFIDIKFPPLFPPLKRGRPEGPSGALSPAVS